MKHLALLVSAFALLGLHRAPSAQNAGTVVAEQKISDTEGGFEGLLNSEERFGRGLASLGDLDGDGVPDLAVGPHYDHDGGYKRGAVWILFLNVDGTVKAHQKISDTEGGFAGILGDVDHFGFAVACLGDLDGDGIQDLAASAVGDNDGGTNRGAVWILFLNANGTVKGHQKISDLEGGFDGVLDDHDQFGRSISGLGDFDADGNPDLVVGAMWDDDGGTDRGAIWILLLNENGTVKSNAKISQTQGNFTGILGDNDSLGWSVASLGDLDGDGVTDVASGAIFDDDGGTDRGAVWIFLLDTDGTVKRQEKISDTEGGFLGLLDNDDFFGWEVASLGDINGDGVTDLSVGAIHDDDGGQNRGAVWNLFLNPNGTVRDHQKISAIEGGFQGDLDDSDHFGSALAAIPELGETYALASGAYWDDDGGTNHGAVWVLFLSTCGTPSSARFRNDSGNTNAVGYVASPPVLGGTWTATVDNAPHANFLALVVGFQTPAEVYLPQLDGYALVNAADPMGELLALPPLYGTGQITVQRGIPQDVGLCGFPLSTQAVGIGAGGFTLHNAFDLVVGTN